MFDVRISVQLAFYALVEHDMQAAPLWDAANREFVGLLTVTDFISILMHYAAEGTPITKLSERTIASVMADTTGVRLKHGDCFDGADAHANLLQCCRLLNGKSKDFLPVILPSDARILAIITYTTILEYLVTNFREQRRLFDDSIYDLNIGTYTDILTVELSTPLHEVLISMDRRNLSAVPVCDDRGVVVSLYSRSDITFLATASDADQAIANMQLPLSEILKQQRNDILTPDLLFTCSRNGTLQSIFEFFASAKFNRLVCVDEEGRCNGIISARDLVKYFCDE